MPFALCKTPLQELASFWHNAPSKLFLHEHVKLPSLAIQVPPFMHGFGEHGLSEQNGGLYPGRQEQEKVKPWDMHEPPLWQGFGEQMFDSKATHP